MDEPMPSVEKDLDFPCSFSLTILHSLTGGPKQVIEYIDRYSHKIAISNHRIKNVSQGKVSFTYKDYAAGGVQKLMTLEATEFLRRFRIHNLSRPTGSCPNVL